jgi:class 3 adenylate cyclase/predicted ATPase
MADEIREWLKALELEEHADAFSENGIDLSLLPELTNNDLKDLGVGRLADRKRIIKVIAEFEASDDKPSASQHKTDRRQLTVLFCDMVGSTELSQQLDPEDMREVIGSYQDAVAGAIERYQGHIAKFLGDGVLAYFCWPQAHEDQAERAVHAALEALEAVSALSTEVGDLAARAGIATGDVVVGDTAGESGAIAGETPNLAARLQAVAKPQQVVIDDKTRKLIGRVFSLDELDEQRLKGFHDKVTTWRVRGEQRVATGRFVAAHGGVLTKFVGRVHELGLLLDRWHLAKDGAGQVVLLFGEAGIGKSRMIQVLQEQIVGETFHRLHYQCSPHHTNSALFPFVQQLQQATALDDDDSAWEKLDKLEGMLAGLGEFETITVALFAELLGIPYQDRYPALDLSPQEIVKRTLRAFSDHLLYLSHRQPLLVIFEDLHWIDPTSLAALELAVGEAAGSKMMVVLTHRLDWHPTFGQQSHITPLHLNRLDRQQGAKIVQAISGTYVDDDVVARIVARADGIPLFVEEVTKSLVESDSDMSAAEIPASLLDLLTARLDRLSVGKQLAQAGAAIGREFSRQLLEYVCRLQKQQFDDATRELSDAGLLFQQGHGPETSYIFKHALIQEAAYNSLLRSQRQRLHQRIAEGLLGQFPRTAELQPELLALHFTEAGKAETAVDYWLQAGRIASIRAANQEAIAHLTAGLAILPALPDSKALARRELDLQLELCGPYMSTRGWGAPETAATFVRARELCTMLGETEQLPPILNGEYFHDLTRGRIRAARERATELLRFGEQQRDAIAILQGHRILAWATLYLGEFSVSQNHVDEVLQRYNPAQHVELTLQYANDTRVAALCVRAILQSLCGYLDQANETTNVAVAYARSIDHQPSLAYALFYAGALPAAMRNEPQKAAEFAKEIFALSERLDSSLWLASSHVISAWSDGVSCPSEDSLQLFHQGLEGLKSAAPNPWQPFYLTLLAEIYVTSGETGRALSTLQNALTLVEKTDERMWEAGIHILLGKTLLRQGSPNMQEAETSFQKGIKVAQSQAAKLLELRAAASLASLQRDQDMPAEARETLTPVFGWFTEGLETLDLRDAKTLLNELY